MTVGVKAALGIAWTLPCLFAMLFLSAGTLDYWQGWLFFAGFALCTIAITLYLLGVAPDLLERRIVGGPRAERERSQKIIQSVNSLAICLVFIIAGLDRRYAWSGVPAWLVVCGFVVSMAAMGGIALVGAQNRWMAATVTVERGQKVVDTGFYAWVRHPMYAAFTCFLVGAPPALGSWWSFVPAAVVFIMLLVRIHYEERYLAANLEGYAAYCVRVGYRLFPFVF